MSCKSGNRFCAPPDKRHQGKCIWQRNVNRFGSTALARRRGETHSHDPESARKRAAPDGAALPKVYESKGRLGCCQRCISLCRPSRLAAAREGCLSGGPLRWLLLLAPIPFLTLDHLLFSLFLLPSGWHGKGRSPNEIRAKSRLGEVRLRQTRNNQAEGDQRDQRQRQLYQPVGHGQRYPKRCNRACAQKRQHLTGP